MISIVGMPEIGKTTLANSTYESPSVTLCFHVHAKCWTSQAYQKTRLLLEILQQVSQVAGQGDEKSDDDPARKL